MEDIKMTHVKLPEIKTMIHQQQQDKVGGKFKEAWWSFISMVSTDDQKVKNTLGGINGRLNLYKKKKTELKRHSKENETETKMIEKKNQQRHQ